MTLQIASLVLGRTTCRLMKSNHGPRYLIACLKGSGEESAPSYGFPFRFRYTKLRGPLANVLTSLVHLRTIIAKKPPEKKVSNLINFLIELNE